MVNCKICKHPYCEHAGTQRGFVVDCNNYMPQAKVNCNQLCEWNDPSDGCVKPVFAICKMSNMSAVRKPQTNGDRIRAMNDEELGRFCVALTCDPIPQNPADYHKWFMEWLKQPVKDGEGE